MPALLLFCRQRSCFSGHPEQNTMLPCAKNNTGTYHLVATGPRKQHVWLFRNSKPLSPSSSSLTQLLTHCSMTCFLLCPRPFVMRKTTTYCIPQGSKGGDTLSQEDCHLKIRALAERARQAPTRQNNPQSPGLNNGRKQLGNSTDWEFK